MKHLTITALSALLCFTLIYSCTSNSSSDSPRQLTGSTKSKKAKKTSKHISSEWVVYDSDYFNFSFQAPFFYSYDVSVSDSLCDYYSSEDEDNFVEIYIWNNRDFDDVDLANFDTLTHTLLEDSGFEYYQTLEQDESEYPTALFKVFNEDPKTSRNENNFYAYYKVIWNQADHSIIDATFGSSAKDENICKKIAESLEAL